MLVSLADDEIRVRIVCGLGIGTQPASHFERPGRRRPAAEEGRGKGRRQERLRGVENHGGLGNMESRASVARFGAGRHFRPGAIVYGYAEGSSARTGT